MNWAQMLDDMLRYYCRNRGCYQNGRCITKAPSNGQRLTEGTLMVL